MFTQLFLPTLSFIIHVLGAAAIFLLSWVIFDALKVAPKREKKYPKYLQGLGFLLVGLYFLLARSFDLAAPVLEAFQILFLLALFCLSAGFYVEPTPTFRLMKKTSVSRPNPAFIILLSLPLFIGLYLWSKPQWGQYFYGLTMAYELFIFVVLFVKVIRGNQRQLGTLGWGFFFLFLAQGTGLLNALLLEDLRFEVWTGIYGGFWLLDILFIFLASFLFIGRYAYAFLRFRMTPQLFMNFFASSFFIFFAVVVVLLLVLLDDFQGNTLFNLNASGKAIEMSIVDKKNDSILAAKALVNNVSFLDAVENEDSAALSSVVQDIFETSGADSIVVTNEAALSLYETLNPDSYGSNFSTDKYFLRALQGEATNTLNTEPGVLAPVILVQTYLPVVRGEQIVGAVMVEFSIDDQLVDSIKEKTGLEVTLFAGNTRSATTFTMDGDLQRLNGTLEENPEVLETVLVRGETYEGTANIFNVEYLCVYSPLKDNDGNIIGMIFVGEPSRLLLALAHESVQTTLRITALLILLSLIPNYFFARRAAMSQMV